MLASRSKINLYAEELSEGGREQCELPFLFYPPKIILFDQFREVMWIVSAALLSLVMLVGISTAQLSEKEKASVVYKLSACVTELETARTVRDSALSKSDNETKRATALEAEIHALRREVLTAEEATAAADDKLRVLEEKLEHCEQSQQQTSSSDEQSARQLSSLSHANEALRVELSAVRQVLDSAIQKLRQANDEVLVLQRESDAMGNDMDALRKQLRALEQAQATFLLNEAEEGKRKPNPYGDHGEAALNWEHDHNSKEESAAREMQLKEAHKAERVRRASADVSQTDRPSAPQAVDAELADEDLEEAPTRLSKAEVEL